MVIARGAVIPGDQLTKKDSLWDLALSDFHSSLFFVYAL